MLDLRAGNRCTVAVLDHTADARSGREWHDAGHYVADVEIALECDGSEPTGADLHQRRTRCQPAEGEATEDGAEGDDEEKND